MRIKLTTTAVEKLHTPGIYWTDTPGLGVRVSPSGTKTYFFQRRVKGSRKERNVSLARHGDPVLLPDSSLRSFPFGADDARAKAAAALASFLAGIDPVAEEERKRAEAEARAAKDKALGTTLQQTIDHYLDTHRVKGRHLRPRTKKDYREFMTRHFQLWLPRAVADITPTMCIDKIGEIEKRSRCQAHKAASYLSIFLNHARDEHADPVTGQPTILAINPVKRARKNTHPPKARNRRIKNERLGAVWLMLRRRAANPVKDLDRTAADYVSTLLLLGGRATEVAAMEWSWINFDAKTVTLPADVETDDPRAFAGVKTHAAITLPLSDVLYDILKARSELESKDARYVFEGRADSDVGHITAAHGTMREVSKVNGDRISPHDLRRSTVSVAIACRVDYALRMRLLNHKPQSVHDDYERDDSPETLRPAVNAIATHIVDASKVAEAQESGANVIMITSRAPKRATLG